VVERVEPSDTDRRAVPHLPKIGGAGHAQPREPGPVKDQGVRAQGEPHALVVGHQLEELP